MLKQANAHKSHVRIITCAYRTGKKTRFIGTEAAELWNEACKHFLSLDPLNVFFTFICGDVCVISSLMVCFNLIISELWGGDGQLERAGGQDEGSHQ